MKTISLDGTLKEAEDIRDGMFKPRTSFGRTALLQADGFHFFVQPADGKTDHAFISTADLWAFVESKCPHFCIPKPVATTDTNAINK
jgi:hypothetical protein